MGRCRESFRLRIEVPLPRRMGRRSDPTTSKEVLRGMTALVVAVDGREENGEGRMIRPAVSGLVLGPDRVLVARVPLIFGSIVVATIADGGSGGDRDCLGC